MLNYEVNTRNAQANIKEVDLESYTVTDVYDDEDRVLITCYLSDPSFTITAGEEMRIAIQYINFAPEDTYVYNFTEIRNVEAAYNNYSYFTFYADKYFDLKCDNLTIYTDDSGAIWLRFEFDDSHYFKSYDENITFYATYVNPNGEFYEQEFSGCVYIDTNTLDWQYDRTFPGISDFMCAVFHQDKYVFKGYTPEDGIVYTEVDEIPEQACFTDPVDVKRKVTVGCEERYEYYTKDCGDGDLNVLDFYRLNFFYDDINQFTIYVDRSYFSVILPISQAFDVNTYREHLIDEIMVQDETRRAINSSPDFEKYVYHPVFVRSDSTEFRTEPIYKIKFNLHFRKRDEEWKVIQDAYWNGCQGNTTQMLTTSNDKFFSYNDPSKQSDLLGYLGFTNSDVKFQKSKLKKSFLRLSYYDSPQFLSQNLIGYSTVFMNAGQLFGRMVNNGMKHPYYVSGDPNSYMVTGAKTNCEPWGNLIAGLNNEQIETMRLSSQFAIEDKNFSTNCSEGFYIYLWADNDPGNLPADLYMRVEFNHAGYGRTIPFMMPYVLNVDSTHPNKKIKSYTEILDDWNSNNEYSFRDYAHFAHIHLKYRYNPGTNTRVYYLDPDTYGNSCCYDGTDESPNELELNLYEVKIQNA